MMNLASFTQLHPVVPYVRECDLPIREAYYYPPRRLLDYLLIFAQKGELSIVADGIGHRLEEGRFCLLQPGTVHSLQAFGYNETPFAHLDIFYHSERAHSFPTRPGQIDLTAYAHLMQTRLSELEGIHVPVLLELRQPARCLQLLVRMIESWLSPDPFGKLEAQAAGTELVYEIIRDHAAAEARTERASQALAWVDAYLSLHLAEPLSIPDMARRAHLSPSRFRDVFRARFGLPPHRYLMRLRLNHAKELLSTTTYSLAEIADNCGFTDASHLSNAFKAAVGMTPGAYRQDRALRPS